VLAEHTSQTNQKADYEYATANGCMQEGERLANKILNLQLLGEPRINQLHQVLSELWGVKVLLMVGDGAGNTLGGQTF
jgi:hypothetical protein